MKLMNKFEFRTWLSYLLLMLGAILAYFVINNLHILSSWASGFLRYASPFIAGFVIAYLLSIPCSWIDQLLQKYSLLRAHSRGIAVLITYTVFISAVTVSVKLLIPEIINSVKVFALNFQFYFQRVMDFITDVTHNEEIVKALGYEELFADLSVRRIIDAIGYESIWQSVVGVLSVSSYLINITIALISSVYMLLEAKSISAFFVRLIEAFIPRKRAALLFKYLTKTNQSFKKFLYCTIIDGIIIGAIAVVILSILKAPFAVVLGIVAGVTNMIPYFGAIVGTVIVIIIVLLADNAAKAIMVGIFLFILQQIDGNVIKIKLYGDSFQISPFVVLFSITVGGAYYGVVGMIIAIPVVAVLKTVIDDILEYKTKKNAENEAFNQGG